jgi:protein SCO1/2
MKAALLILACALLAACAARRPEPFDPFHLAGVDPRPGAVVPLDLKVRDEAGRPTSLRRLAHGLPLVLAPVQHRCPNLCGLTLDGLAGAVAGQDLRPGRDFVLVAFGIDPRETSQDAALSVRRLARAGPSGVHAVVADPAATRAVTHALGYRYAWDRRMQQYAHIAAVAVLTPDGRLARWLYGVAPKSRDLGLALARAERGEPGGLGEQIRLICYHYAPLAGRYSGAILQVLRWAGAAFALALAAMIGLGLARRRRGRGAR